MIFEMLIIAFLMVVAIVLILLEILCYRVSQLPVSEDSLLPAACSMPIRSVRRSAM